MLMQKDIEPSGNKVFQFPGSKTQYPPSLPFVIDNMLLTIRPDFETKTLKDCLQELKITTNQDIQTIELDIAEIKVHGVSCYVTDTHTITIGSSDSNFKELPCRIKEGTADKLIIELEERLQEGSKINVVIRYSAGMYFDHEEASRPRSGFHFIGPDNQPSSQAWTQGEAIESRYWFPCLDDPQVKFPREIRVIAPDDNFVVVSNGTLSQDGNTWSWIERNKTPAYLTSVVIGREFDKEEYIDKNNDIPPLLYYWPNRVSKENAMLTFKHTPEMMKLFKQYLSTNYHYDKYSQAAVDEFEDAGMENTSCTTLGSEYLHDEKASHGYKFDKILICHELAHQWFGDLVTCKHWQHIWLNEGFANYFEALYYDKDFINHLDGKLEGSYKRDEYQYKIRQTADTYFAEANMQYKRPIVTKVYKHPDEMFDSHSYEKAGFVLHMIRNYMGERHFRDSLKLYLDRYSDQTAETDDLRKIFEETSGMSLQWFFDQWFYRAGHPELNVEFSIDQDSSELSVKVIQVQEEDAFEFPLEIKVAYSDGHEELRTLNIKEKEEEEKIQISQAVKIMYISVDPEFKILHAMKSIRVPAETGAFNLEGLLKSQVQKGKTVIEKIRAIRRLSDKYSPDVVEVLKNRILKDEFYGVSIESANILGGYNDKADYNKTRNAYDALKTCLEKRTFLTLSDEVREAVVNNIGNFEREETIEALERILLEKDKSYFVEQAAATAIGRCSKYLSSDKKKHIIRLLKDTVNSANSFQNVISQGAIEGLKVFWNDKDKNVVIDVANFLLEKSQDGNDYFIRSSSTSALGKFIRTKIENGDKFREDIIKTNHRVFANLIKSLTDKRRSIKINACTALADPDAVGSKPDGMVIETIDALISVSEHDVDGFVRTKAERTLNVLREWIKEWSNKPPLIELKLREKADPIEIIEEKKRIAEHFTIEETKKKQYEERLKLISRPSALH
jgi:aminopeptidase N